MYNEIEFDLEPLELPNILYVHRKGRRVTDKISTHPFLRPLLNKIAKAKPKWKLFGVQIALREDSNGNAFGWASTFHAYENGVLLGTIAKEYNYSSSCDVFSLDTQRMAAKRRRGHSTTTKDLNKAFKIVTKEFRGKNPLELAEEAVGAVRTVASTVTGARQSPYRSLLSNMRGAFTAFAENNWALFEEFVRDTKPAGVPNIDNYFNAKTEHDEAEKLDDAISTREGNTVVLYGEKYIVVSGMNVSLYASEELTPHMKRVVGMLKLTDKGTFIPNMGLKASDTVMYVMPEEAK